jgi:hypothetical protein
VSPHTVVSTDPDEMRAALSQPARPPARDYPQAIADEYPGWDVRETALGWVASCPAVTLTADGPAELRAAIERVICEGDDRD